MNCFARSLFALVLYPITLLAADGKPGAEALNRWVGGETWTKTGEGKESRQ
jgi:hypothetical protein